MRISIHLRHPTVACWNFSGVQAQRLQSLLPDVEIYLAENEREFLEALPETDIALVWRFEESWLGRASKLEWIVTPAAGRDYFHVAPRDGLDIDYGSFHGPLIGETVLGMLLGDCRGLFFCARLQPEQPWPRAELAKAMRTLQGSRLTILGFGSIGRSIGRLAKPFGVRITGVSRRAGELPDYFEPADRCLAIEALDDCLPETDFLVLSLPATRATDYLIEARRIARLPSHAVVVNVGRGNAIDEDALAAALIEGKLAGAYLDVYSTEPLPSSSPLRQAPNAFLFPHASAIAPQYLDLFTEEFVLRFKRRYDFRSNG